MAVEDRVAFALMFLSDNKLCEYLRKLTQKLTEKGNLAGFLLTGIMNFSDNNCILICNRSLFIILSYIRCKYGRNTVIK